MRTLFGLAVLAAATYLLMQESSSFNRVVTEVRQHPATQVIADRVTDSQKSLFDAADASGADTAETVGQLANLQQETALLREEVDTLHALVAALVAPHTTEATVKSGEEVAGVPSVDDSSEPVVASALSDDRRRALRELSERMELQALGI